MYLSYYPKPRPCTSYEELERQYNKIKNTFRTLEVENLSRAKSVDVQNKVSKVFLAARRVITDNRMLWNSSPEYIIACNNYKASNQYCTFQIPKHNGGMRTIAAPNETLKSLQRDMLEALQQKAKVLPHNAAHGCVKRRNCKTALEVHQRNNSKWFLKLDLHDAFGSVREEPLLAELNKNAIMDTVLRTWYISTFTALAFNSRVSEGLPQGSPLSPFLLNMFLYEFDVLLTVFCKEHGLVYTRYVDDLLISGYNKFDKDLLIQFVKEHLPENMTINDSKTRFGSINWKNWNLGIMLNKDNKLTPGAANKHKLKCAIHNFNTRPEAQTREEYYHLSGVLAYYKYIDPEYFENNLHFVLVQPTNEAHTLPAALE